MLKNKLPVIIALILVFSLLQPVSAQDGAQLPVYIVQPGENLTEIAQKFNITLQELISTNNISNIDLISAGTELLIPGLEGVNGVLTTETVNFGDQLRTILQRNNLSIENFEKLNPITSPAEIYVGSTLVLPQQDAEIAQKSNVVLDSGESQFTSAVAHDLNPWVFSIENGINPSDALPQDVYFYPSGGTQETVSTFSNLISRIEVKPLPVSQGHTSVIYIYAKEPGNFTGTYGNKNITFFQDAGQGFFYAFNGISAIADTGLVPLTVSGQFDNGQQFSVEQNLLLTSGNYPEENLTVEQTLIDQSLTDTENQLIQQILAPISPDKLWVEPFRLPVDGSLDDDTIAFTSYFGSRRSYNNGQYSGYHGGLDFKVVLMSLNVYADAPGRVIFAGPTDIRGNTIFLDHGQGVVSGFGHMRELKVNVGDYVEKGQIIGIIGQTGRVTGPHLHWDIWVNGTPVQPFDWVDNNYP